MLSASLLLAMAVAPADLRPFGRFGRLHDDGLLTMNVGPGYAVVPPQYGGYGYEWDVPKSTPKVSLSYSHKSFTWPDDGSAGIKSLSWNLASQYVKIRFRDSFTVRGRTVPASLPKKVDLGEFLGLNVSGKTEGKTRTYTTTAEDKLGSVTLGTPGGLAVGNFASNPRDVAIPSAWQFVSKTDSTVTLRQVATNDGERMAVPPVLLSAIDGGYPAKILEPVTRYSQTLYGPYGIVRGKTLTVTLPIPPMEDRIYLSTSVTPAEASLLKAVASELDLGWAKNSVDLCYSRACPAWMARAYLPADVAAKAKAGLRPDAAFSLPPYKSDAKLKPWQTETEPLTGQSYLWTYFIKGEGPYKYDIEWGNALPVYGLYQWSGGDPQKIKPYWAAVNKVWDYMRLAEDWAWMTVVNADHGYSTGTGDPMAAYYAGAAARYKMARALGDTTIENEALAEVARVAVPMVAKLGAGRWAESLGVISPNRTIVGYSELQGYTRVQTGQEDPWGPTTLLSGNGCQPEVMSLYKTYAADSLKTFFKTFDTAYPQWRDPKFQYPFATSYSGNSGYVVFPQLYARAILGYENPASLAKTATAVAAQNNVHGWVGANVVAELISMGTPLYLTGFENCVIESARLGTDGKTATIQFRRLTAGKPVRLIGALRGTAVPSPDYGKLSQQGKSFTWVSDPNDNRSTLTLVLK
jgi:hypothetical protein